MRSAIRQLRVLRQELEAHRPPTGAQKWTPILQSLRVAGQPRSVSAAVHVVLFNDIAADTSVDELSRRRFRELRDTYLQYAAIREIAWLDQDQLTRFLQEYRENGYREPGGYQWVENRDSVPYPPPPLRFPFSLT